MHADSSYDTEKKKNNGTEKEEKLNCSVSPVKSHVSYVACHLSLKPTATVTDPSVAISPTMHSRLVCKDSKTPRKI